ncbi:MAG: HNH endonuclease [Candidatus Hodarchaeota archaeon]
MKGYIGVTDNDWYKFLASLPDVDEVNFWQPGGGSHFKVLKTGEPFFFKLHSPLNYIAGGGFFAHSSIIPVSLAWEAFQEKNGAPSYLQMRRLIEKRRRVFSQFEDYKIGCIILTEPFFLKRDDWIPIPPDFSLNIVQGKSYDLSAGYGLNIWNKVQEILKKGETIKATPNTIGDPEIRYGEPTVVLPRLGQGSFRIMVADAYERRCAITNEKTLPALEAAHIKPFSASGPHRVGNGILLRSDIHKLFDSGYVTITPKHNFEVSRRIRDEYENGRDYYALNGKKIYVPPSPTFRPEPVYLAWHNENVFRG